MKPVSAIDAGQATMVRTKAMGQAMMNCLGQVTSHSMDGPPEKIMPRRPDIVAAMMKVMMIWERKMLFLLNVGSFSGTTTPSMQTVAPPLG